jgi:hypothetical protein
MLTRMDRSGRVIGTPVPALGGATSTVPGESFKLYGPYDPEVSPDGRKIAYWATAYNPSSTGETIYTDFRDLVLVTPSDRFEMPRANWVTSVRSPSWLTNDRVAVTGSGLTNMSFETFLPGMGDDGLQWWFRNVNALEGDWELSRDGRKIVSVAQTNGATSPADTLHFFSVPGAAWTAPPYTDTWKDDAPRPEAGQLRCQSVRDSVVRNPSWSPSGSAIAYEDGDGIWVQQVPDIALTCGALDERLLVPGGRHADWGPADVDLAQRPAATSGPGVPVVAAGPGNGAAPGSSDRPARGALRSIAAPASARRRAGVKVTLAMDREARVTLTLCPGSATRCGRKGVQRSLVAKKGVTRVILKSRRLRRGRHTLTVQAAGGPPIRRVVRLR